MESTDDVEHDGNKRLEEGDNKTDETENCIKSWLWLYMRYVLLRIYNVSSEVTLPLVLNDTQ